MFAMGQKRTYAVHVIGRKPDTDKENRMARHQGRLEAGRISFPTEAPWLAEFESELLAFPHGRHDDQVDAVLLFLDWFGRNEGFLYPTVSLAGPIIVRADHSS